MLSKDDILARRDQIIAIAKQFGASNVRIFGSVARGDATDASDLDLIVRFDPDRSLFDHGALIDELEYLLNIKFGVVSEGGMRNRFRAQVMKEAISL